MLSNYAPDELQHSTCITSDLLNSSERVALGRGTNPSTVWCGHEQAVHVNPALSCSVSLALLVCCPYAAMESLASGFLGPGGNKKYFCLGHREGSILLNHGVIEYSELEGSRKDHQVQLLALHRITPKVTPCV